jgi:hypothetical protein
VPDLDFLIHLPLLRIEEELLPFAGARLYRAPFQKYDEITAGAFSDHRARYESTEPVFLSFTEQISEEGLERRIDEVHGLVEIKIPSARTAMLDQLGLHAINWAHQKVATRAWSALLLAAPAAALAPPRWSQSFVSIGGGFTMNIGGRATVGARVQGEADHEYLFLPDAPSERIPIATIAHAAELVPAVREWEQVPDLHAALTALRATGLPMLGRQDRMTIAVQAIESLLLPEVRTNLTRTFSRRAAALLANDVESAHRIEALARELYALRSESVHGSELRHNDAFDNALAEQMLAAAIQALGRLVARGQTTDEVRAQLDRGYPSVEAASVRIMTPAIGRSASYRLAPRDPSSDVFSFTSSMYADDGRVCCWSPLLGLTTHGLEQFGPMVMGTPPAPVLMPLSPSELNDLEERDIRRDFFREFIVHGLPMAVLLTVPKDPEAPTNPLDAKPYLERMRDLGVVALRLAGYDQFHNPELFGSALFEGKRRLRCPTVLRQTIAEEIRHQASQSVGPDDQPRLAKLWQEISRYEQDGLSPTIEQVLSLFRRSFDREFLEPEQRALILVSLLELMLGRFRKPTEAVQLEDLVEALLGPSDDVSWFRHHGRKYRNRVAHGEFGAEDAGEPIECLSRVISRLVMTLITTWNVAEHSAQNHPPKALLDYAMLRVKSSDA